MPTFKINLNFSVGLKYKKQPPTILIIIEKLKVYPTFTALNHGVNKLNLLSKY